MSRSKVTPEQRIEAGLSYLNGEGSYKFIADRYGVEQTRIKVWVRQYKANGPLAFKEQQHNTVYAPELKANAVLDYLAGNGSIQTIAESTVCVHLKHSKTGLRCIIVVKTSNIRCQEEAK